MKIHPTDQGYYYEVRVDTGDVLLLTVSELTVLKAAMNALKIGALNDLRDPMFESLTYDDSVRRWHKTDTRNL